MEPAGALESWTEPAGALESWTEPAGALEGLALEKQALDCSPFHCWLYSLIYTLISLLVIQSLYSRVCDK